MVPFSSPKTKLLSGRQLISYHPLYLLHTSFKVRTTDFAPGVLHMQTLQQGRKCMWLPNAVKICDLSFLSTLSYLLLLYPTSILRVVWLFRVSHPFSKPQDLFLLAEFACTLVLVPDLDPCQISEQ